MTREEIEKIVKETIAKQTQTVEDLPTSDNLSDFITLPIIAADGSMKTLRADLLKGKQGDKGDTGERGLIGLQGLPGEDGRIRLIHHGTADTTFALTPNTMHVWGEVESLNLSLAPNTDPNILAEYDFQFTTPANKATEFQLQGVEWYEGVVPTILKGKTYQGSVVNGVAILISN